VRMCPHPGVCGVAPQISPMRQWGGRWDACICLHPLVHQRLSPWGRLGKLDTHKAVAKHHAGDKVHYCTITPTSAGKQQQEWVGPECFNCEGEGTGWT
jgi:hypothetical protein